ncbi:uncharacterized protein LOC121870368 [Homarus americanus]|nr:uncharacterized protein LOC121870368 [Homarus americanus]
MMLWEEIEKQSRNSPPEESTQLKVNPEKIIRKPPEWMRDYFYYKFMMLDAAGDGVLDEDEFVYMMTQYGASEQDAKKSWFLMAKGRRVLTREVFEELCEQFFLSDDPNDPGTYLSARLYFIPGEQRDTAP